MIKTNTIMKFNKLKRVRLFYSFILLVQLGLGAIFIWSSLPKILQPYNFLSSIYSYELVGPKLGILIAMVLPCLELLVGICLVGQIFNGGALLASAAMAAMFTFVLSSALYRGLDISCGCFGTNGGVISYSTILRASLILLLSIVAYIGVAILRPYAWKYGNQMKAIDVNNL